MNSLQLPEPATAETPAIAAPPWIELPSDVAINILRRLGADELLQSAQFVCATWWNLCRDPAMWRVIRIDERIIDFDYSDDAMWRRVVDRSQGQLIDLTIDNFNEEDELLGYVADRSAELGRLTLAQCSFSPWILTAALKKLPNLEELHFIQTDYRPVSMEFVGPRLKSFTFVQSRCKHPPLDESPDYEGHLEDKNNNYEALEIANYMPNLCRLRLLANDLNDNGLQAILDGCPRLESLDLRQCFGVDLGGALGERCRQQIKDLRLPSDSVDDFGYDFLPAGEITDDEYEDYNLTSADFGYDSDTGCWDL